MILFMKANASGNLDFIILSLFIGIIAPPIISIIVVMVLHGYMEGLFEGMGFVAFAGLAVIINGIYLIIKGRKKKETSFVMTGVFAIIMQLILGIAALAFASGGIVKIGG